MYDWKKNVTDMVLELRDTIRLSLFMQFVGNMKITYFQPLD